ncbi:MAG: nitroreductase family protein [Actinomycetota bacterium]|jgi:nitroreductase|nr:nitroreductase family protein [Actinomycetota bacterium]
MNSTIDSLNTRSSTRVFVPDSVSAAEREAILHSTMRAPTGGNMMLYSIIEIEDPALKARLAITCDDQPFIATAPWVLVFVADFQKWIDLFAVAGVDRVEGVEHRMTPGSGDLMLACSDALIAAQNAVVAAESLGIGSCYIGDILENGEEHARLLNLPQHTFPVGMLVLGRRAKERPPTPHYTGNMVHRDGYHRLNMAERLVAMEELAAMHAPHGFKLGIENHAQAVYARKYSTDFMREMNRSVAWWLERWETAENAGENA